MKSLKLPKPHIRKPSFVTKSKKAEVKLPKGYRTHLRFNF